MRLTKRKKQIFLVLLIMIAAALLWVYGIYNGYFQLNNPSRRQYPIRGVDVSHYQGNIDWEVLSQENISFAYIKATEGSSHQDDRFAENWEAVKETGLKAGAYHFFSFDSPGVNQAQNYISVVGADTAGRSLPPVVDVEYYADKKQNQPVGEDVRRELQGMLDGLYQYYQVKPVIYTTGEVWKKYLQGYFNDYPLWIRAVSHRPMMQDDQWTFWQFSNRGRLAGYSGEEKYIDLNVFNGNKAAWEKFCGSTAGES